MEEAEEVWKDAASSVLCSPPVGSTRCCCVPVGRFRGMTSPNCGDVTVAVVVIVVVMVVDGSIVVDEDEASDIWLRLLSGLLLLFIVT